MAKKFKDGLAEMQNCGPDLRITLLDYVQLYAPDVLLPLAVMEGATALRFWQEIFQSARPGEGKRFVNECIRWPYAERIVYLAREFNKLDERCRRYVVKAARAGIWWRGDDIQRFRAIVAAHLNYRGLSEDERVHYRKRLMSAAKNMIARQAG